MKKTWFFWVTTTLISFFGFYLIEHIFTVSPESISGNGNLGIIFIMLFSPFFLASYIFTFRLTSKLLKKAGLKFKIGIFLFSVLGCALLVYAIIHYKNELVIALGGPPTNPESRIFRFGWFNQYTNSLFFNIYTFFLSYIFIIFLGTLLRQGANK
ncbi:hypothetical protein [Lederbergia panacisoli]|uniref:hypothetical protein n=1 Tax=Lederbergia panacisoli TaxID=1255251 RepID=UPI00214AEE30|nr:hypothetical protein [Lederbergia panacisoli]MCR2822602.1 hypothetical protein [Lederbergia panacisoli]